MANTGRSADPVIMNMERAIDSNLQSAGSIKERNSSARIIVALLSLEMGRSTTRGKDHFFRRPYSKG